MIPQLLRTTQALPSVGEALQPLLGPDFPLHVELYDGSWAGPPATEFTLRIIRPRALAHLVTAPGELGLARAYVDGDLELDGAHPADPYEPLTLLMHHYELGRPNPADVLALARTVGPRNLTPPPVPPQEQVPQWRRTLEGLRHSRGRDAEVISHHYDVSNTFYRHVLGPSMTYTCSVFPRRDATLEEAQAEKYDLIARKLGLQAGQRLLDVGCGWGGMVLHAAREYGVRATGVTLSRQQAEWAQQQIEQEGLTDLAEVRHGDYRDVPEDGFDAVSSIGLTEHLGVRNYASYFAFLRDRLRPGGRLLNHCITRPHNRPTSTGAFIDRYVFPDGELTGSGRIITEAQDAGFEVQHTENLREHYALTLAEWCRNLHEHWDECVDEVGPGTAKVWGLYMAGSRLAFERNEIQLTHVLAARTEDTGTPPFALRPQF